MSYDIQITIDVKEYLEDLDEKSSRICRKNLKKLEETPFPGRGRGDKAALKNSEYYRLHIGREYTAIYSISNGNSVVKVIELLTIDQAHKRYGHYS